MRISIGKDCGFPMGSPAKDAGLFFDCFISDTLSRFSEEISCSRQPYERKTVFLDCLNLLISKDVLRNARFCLREHGFDFFLILDDDSSEIRERVNENCVNFDVVAICVSDSFGESMKQLVEAVASRARELVIIGLFQNIRSSGILDEAFLNSRNFRIIPSNERNLYSEGYLPDFRYDYLNRNFVSVET